MFDPTSRYYDLPTTTYETPSGDQIAYKRRRFLPQSETLPLLQEVTIMQGDRLDLLTARTLGMPEQYWRVCDANNVLNPVSMLQEPGRKVRVPLPYPQETTMSMPWVLPENEG